MVAAESVPAINALVLDAAGLPVGSADSSLLVGAGSLAASIGLVPVQVLASVGALGDALAEGGGQDDCEDQEDDQLVHFTYLDYLFKLSVYNQVGVVFGYRVLIEF